MGLERIDDEYGLAAVVDEWGRMGLRAAVFDLDGPPHQRVLVAHWDPQTRPNVAEVTIDLPNRGETGDGWQQGNRDCPDFGSAIEGVPPGETWMSTHAAMALWAIEQAKLIVPRPTAVFLVGLAMEVEASTSAEAVEAAVAKIDEGTKGFLFEVSDGSRVELVQWDGETATVLDPVEADEVVRRG